ncbi:hypothetical protein CEXT_791511 [Caerostris extrusa]|uniref:Uncharacterized protein n=1 Tax=Caerostris extrusa TaxID=172846 RepID=A0AAV4X8X5_CAEEX|nr:hypothetical protein CEXT_791511 [Caerostris extrusa]
MEGTSRFECDISRRYANWNVIRSLSPQRKRYLIQTFSFHFPQDSHSKTPILNSIQFGNNVPFPDDNSGEKKKNVSGKTGLRVNFRIVDGIMRRTKQENVTEGNALQLSKEVPMRRGANERFLSSIQFCLNFYSVSYDIQSDVF